MGSFKDHLMDELKLMKKGIFRNEDFKKLVDDMPADFVCDKDVLLLIFEACPPVSHMEDHHMRDELLQMFKTLFDRVENYGEAVVTYFDLCLDHDDGPFGISNFPIGRYINEIETYYGNHNDVTFEECLEPSKLFAWALIGNTKDCLRHFCNQSVVMPTTMLNFLRCMFEHVLPVCNYNAEYKNIKGSLILVTMREIIEAYADFHKNLETIQFMVLRMTIPRKKKQLSLISPNLLFDEIIEHLVVKDMVQFWLQLFGNFVRDLKKNSIKLDWDSSSRSMYNPVYLSVFLIKLSLTEQMKEFDPEELFKNLGELFKAQNVEFVGTNVFKGCDEIDWALKFAYLDFLQVPSTSYEREVPSALFHVLSAQARKNYTELVDAEATFINYLTGIFELAFTAEHIPDEFFDDAGTKYPQAADPTNFIAICMHLACSNLLPFRDVKIKESTYRIIDKLLIAFDCQIDLGGNTCTRSLYEAVWSMQPCLVIGRAAVAGIHTHHSVTSPEAIVDYHELDKASLKLLSTFFGLANKCYRPYYDELRAALEDRRPRVLSRRLEVMSTVYILLKKLTSLLSKNLGNPPEELKLLENRLNDYLNCYGEYVEKTYVPREADADVPTENFHNEFNLLR